MAVQICRGKWVKIEQLGNMDHHVFCVVSFDKDVHLLPGSVISCNIGSSLDALVCFSVKNPRTFYA